MSSFAFQIGVALALLGVCCYLQTRVENARKRIRVRIHNYNRPTQR